MIVLFQSENRNIEMIEHRSIENVKSARFCQGKKGFIELHFLGKTKRSASKQLQKKSRMLQVFRCSFSSASRIFVVASVELHFDSRIPAFPGSLSHGHERNIMIILYYYVIDIVFI